MESHKLGGLKQSVNLFAHSLEARSLESTLAVLILSGGQVSDRASHASGDGQLSLRSLGRETQFNLSAPCRMCLCDYLLTELRFIPTTLA